MATILIIEDNTDIRENAAELLELEGHRVICAVNGREGLEKVKEQPVELIICDIHMPELNGYEVLRHLRGDPFTAGIPFIYLTARTESADVRFGLNEGADLYLKKPFDETDLFEAVNRCLGH